MGDDSPSLCESSVWAVMDTLAPRSEAPRPVYDRLECRLIARKTPPKPSRRHVYLYDVEFQGKIILTGSSDPGKPRSKVNILKAAKLRTSEQAGKRAYFAPYTMIESRNSGESGTVCQMADH
jgi:hypothetical protein